MKQVGVDISKKSFHIAVLAGDKQLSKVFDNSPAGHRDLQFWLAKKGVSQSESHVCMEATSTYYEGLAMALAEAGWRVSVVNPLQIKAFAESRLIRQKTDRADAHTIALFCSQQNPPLWSAPAPEVRELQRLLARLEAVQGMRTQELNRLHEAQGIARESVERLLNTLDEELRLLKQQIDDHIDRHPGLKEQTYLLKSIPGVGDTLSAYMMAWLPVARLDDVRAAVAFVGLSPKARESGTSLRGKAILCKMGHSRLRKMLYMPAMNAMRFNPAAKALATRLREAGKPGKLILGAIMRKLVHWIYGVLKSRQVFNVNLALAKA
jgi:transposase